ncbi:MAG: glycosyltransferase [Candidatus Sericytochromatia bacterium]|nr:glycosyltransferase [Candidatus Sericytochromatia bacterium]
MPALLPRVQPPVFSRPPSLALSVVVALAEPGPALLTLLRALRDARLPLACEVIVVVAGTEGAALAGVRAEFPLVLLYRAPPGTERGKLYDVGVRAAGGGHLLLLDGSAIPTAAAIAELHRFAESGQFIGAVVPRYLAPDGSDQASSRAFPTPRAVLRAALGPVEATPELQRAFSRMVTTPREVEAAEGGCLLVRRAALQDVGGLDAGYPDGGEVWDWCQRARLKGWAVFLHPGVHASLVGPRDPEAGLEVRGSIRRFLYRFRGLAPAAAAFLLMLPADLRDRRRRRCRARLARISSPARA